MFRAQIRSTQFRCTTIFHRRFTVHGDACFSFFSFRSCKAVRGGASWQKKVKKIATKNSMSKKVFLMICGINQRLPSQQSQSILANYGIESMAPKVWSKLGAWVRRFKSCDLLTHAHHYWLLLTNKSSLLIGSNDSLLSRSGVFAHPFALFV